MARPLPDISERNESISSKNRRLIDAMEQHIAAAGVPGAFWLGEEDYESIKMI